MNLRTRVCNLDDKQFMDLPERYKIVLGGMCTFIIFWSVHVDPLNFYFEHGKQTFLVNKLYKQRKTNCPWNVGLAILLLRKNSK